MYCHCFQKVSSANPTDAVNQIKEEKKKENEAVNQHQNDVSGSLIPCSNRSGFHPGSEKALKSGILCCILKSQLLGRKLTIAQRKKPHIFQELNLALVGLLIHY